MKWWDWMPRCLFFECWVLSSFFTLLFHFHQRLFSSSLLYAIRVLSSACLRLLIFLQAVLIPACVSSISPFCMMYSACKFNKGDNIQPWRTAFLIWNQSIVPCPILTVTSWTACRLLRRQVRWSGIPISWRIFHSMYFCTMWRYAFSISCWIIFWKKGDISIQHLYFYLEYIKMVVVHS